MIKERLIEANKIERSGDEITPRAGLIMFDGFMKVMKVIPSDSATGDWLLRNGKGKGIDGIDKVNREVDIKLLKMEKHKEYTLWADPMITDLGDKGYAERLYTGQKEIVLCL